MLILKSIDERSVFIKEIFGAIAPHPLFNDPQVLRIRFHN